MKRIIYFDGVCHLCQWSVRFILRYDKRQRLSFASLQSEYAKKYLLYVNGLDIKSNTIVYQRDDIYLIKSEAVLKILNDIGGVWKIFLVFSLLPKSLRNFIYDLVANNRYRWFGKDDSCMIPNKEIKSRFLNWHKIPGNNPSVIFIVVPASITSFP